MGLGGIPGVAAQRRLRSALPRTARGRRFPDGKDLRRTIDPVSASCRREQVTSSTELTEPRSDGLYNGESYHRPDGSYL